MGSIVSKKKNDSNSNNNNKPSSGNLAPTTTAAPTLQQQQQQERGSGDITVPKKADRILTVAKPAPPTPLLQSLKDNKLSLEEAAKQRAATIDEMWKIVKQSSDLNFIDLKPSTSRKGWKTIRLFVSSTFKDFHQEREVLVKEVFPDLRLWCESRKLRLVECDLRWGVPKDSTTEETIKICLSELDRCYEDNAAPFFLNLAGDRAGWIPKFEDFSLNLAAQYGWVYGLAVTEMEIVHGAIRRLNPNALFLLRNMEGREKIPDDMKEDFYSGSSDMREKLDKLKTMITDTFPETNVKNYNVSCELKNGQVMLQGLIGENSCFSNMVFDFFKSKITNLYPLDSSPSDPLQIQRDAHEMFQESRSSCVLGRDKILAQIEDYVINGNSKMAPVLVVGTTGAGKSALMAKSAQRATELARQGAIKMKSESKCRVFFHFVGATPGSTHLESFLQRLTKEMQPNQKDLPSDMESLINQSHNFMENESTEPIVIFVDAINQLDEDKQQYLNRWLPEKLSPNVRVIISTIESTVSHQTIQTFKTNPTEIVCGPLDKESRQAIVENILRTYNKRLDDEQITVLLDKNGSSNPLWLSLACEELRVYGQFETLINKIHELPDDLISLEENVFVRFEGETGRDHLMKACVCMLEVSRHGLLETELLALLGDSKNIKVSEYVEQDEDLLKKTETNKDTTEEITETKPNLSNVVQEMYVKENGDDSDGDNKRNDGKQKSNKVQSKRSRGKQINFLPARDWALIYRNLKPLLRPCGDLGEGRLDFYHRSLSKAVRRRYFSGEEKLKKHAYNFWHGVLADYFEGVDDINRKAEELPYHLEQLRDNNRLIRCLMDWEVFECLYNKDSSIDLLHFWRQCGGYGIASNIYTKQLTILKKSDMPLKKYVEIVEKVYGFLTQAGQYWEAFHLMQERVVDELRDMGARPEKMADMFHNMARCMNEISETRHFNNPNHDKQIVEFARNSLHHRKRCKEGADNTYQSALTNILIAPYLSRIVEEKAAKQANRDKQVKQALETIEQAEEVFREWNDIGHMAECAMTKAIIDFKKPFAEYREPLFKESLALCLRGYGERHLLTTRIYLNMGIAYENAGEAGTAFECFKKLREICLAMFGPDHPTTMRAIKQIKSLLYINGLPENFSLENCLPERSPPQQNYPPPRKLLCENLFMSEN